MEVRVLLRDGTHLEGRLYADSQLQKQLATKYAISEYFSKMYNRVYFRSKCLTGSFRAVDVNFWELTGSRVQLGE